MITAPPPVEPSHTVAVEIGLLNHAIDVIKARLAATAAAPALAPVSKKPMEPAILGTDYAAAIAAPALAKIQAIIAAYDAP